MALYRSPENLIDGWMDGWTDGWMDDFLFSTVFLPYQDNERTIMKGCVQWNPLYGLEDFASSGIRTRGPLEQQASA